MEQTLEVSLKGGAFRRLLEQRFTRVRQQYGLKMVEIDVLYFLAEHRTGNTPTDVYRQLKLNRGHISQAVESLCRREYLTPIPDQRDRRSVHYRTTPQAGPIVAEIDRIRSSLDAEIFQGISREELDAYAGTSRKICQNLNRLLQDPV